MCVHVCVWLRLEFSIWFFTVSGFSITHRKIHTIMDFMLGRRFLASFYSEAMFAKYALQIRCKEYIYLQNSHNHIYIQTETAWSECNDGEIMNKNATLQLHPASNLFKLPIVGVLRSPFHNRPQNPANAAWRLCVLFVEFVQLFFVISSAPFGPHPELWPNNRKQPKFEQKTIPFHHQFIHSFAG